MAIEKYLGTKIGRRDFLKDSAYAASGILAATLPMGSAIGQLSKPQLADVPGGKVWTSPAGNLRIQLVGDKSKGYDVAFQTRVDSGWQTVAAFPEGKVWSVCNHWGTTMGEPRWYGGENGFKILQITPHAEEGYLECAGQGSVGGQPWEFIDHYSFEYGAVKVTRRWHHAAAQTQSPITLVTAIRTDVGKDARWLLPGILYNDNPGSYPTRQVPHLPQAATVKGLYEEHRFPVPFVNLESTVAKDRRYVSLLTVPSKVPGGHKGDDQWWSLGMQWLWEEKADLLLTSGAVATNGMNSTVYGHVYGFDPYDDAFIDVPGDVTIEKTFFIDFGIAPRTGYAFRETLWKAFQIFQPVKTQSLPFSQAMDLKYAYAAEAFIDEPKGVAGFPLLPSGMGFPPAIALRFMYGWAGRIDAAAYALLNEADRKQNENDRRMGLDTLRFYTQNVRQDTPGLLFGDYLVLEKKWVGFFGLPDWPESISSRQLGEILDHLAESTAWALRKQVADAQQWQALLVKSGDFLVTAKRYQGMYPRTWYPDGRPVGWDGEKPALGTVSAAGAFLVAPLAKLYRLTGDNRYLETAESALRAYYEAYARDLKQSYAGATLDAECEDKEGGQGFLHGAMALYEVTKNAEYLEMARDAADWVLTWCYFHDVQFPSGVPAHGFVNSVGWTAVSVQLPIIDVFGDYSAPDLYKLGEYLHDERYQQLARTIFLASTQTIARPGAMFGLPKAGMQHEHVNQTNFTYIVGGPWRGGIQTPGIVWTLPNTLYNGQKLIEMGAFTR